MAYATVADLTVDQFKALMREVVIQTLTEVLGDPAEDLELRDDITTSKSKWLPRLQRGKQILGHGFTQIGRIRRKICVHLRPDSYVG
jgi:hypothetical protein